MYLRKYQFIAFLENLKEEHNLKTIDEIIKHFEEAKDNDKLFEWNIK